MLVRSLAALACGAVATLALGVSPASAAPAASCDGALVLWDNINYNGTHICFGSWESESDLGKVSALPGGSMQDKTSSVQNFTDSAFCLYVDNNYSGDRFTVDAHTSIVDMRVPNPYWNDKISSVRPGAC
ncbi:peptidase inhibitor family I36 protein [Streptomyces sp. enrichment culture]|uniref:peptidase inhibitor family I36 protein n=1 Tax=Streptomyces sp. enrichment culture TaxID=1795815 RepID=UPI003F575182